MSRTTHEVLLLTEFVAAFAAGDCSDYGCEPGQPIPVETSVEALADLRAMIPVSLPPLYERLLLSYRWPESDLGRFRLLANPAGPRLKGLLDELTRDAVLWNELTPRGWIRFGKGAGTNYDPVCFDIRQRRKDGDYRIVQLDHEQILCNARIKVVAELAPSFRELVESTVAARRLSA